MIREEGIIRGERGRTRWKQFAEDAEGAENAEYQRIPSHAPARASVASVTGSPTRA